MAGRKTRVQDLNGKTAIVTGAASGIGIAKAPAGGGMNLVLADIQEAALTAARRDRAEAWEKAQ
jgi:NAD(P)-dependent dehydrogenase (short-subunit alcohol dehydrogenase family)